MEVIKFHLPGSSLLTLSDQLNRYADHVHELNRIWWYEEGSTVKLERVFGELMQLALSEVAEAMEGFRKNLMDDHLPQYPMLWTELADGVIRILDSAGAYEWNIEYGKIDFLISPAHPNVAARLLNLSDLIIRTAHSCIEKDSRQWLTGNLIWHFIDQSFDIATTNGCPDFWQVVYDKLVYNRSRADHSYAARALPNGKKF